MRPEPPPAGKILRESKGALLVHPTIESKLRGVWETCPNGPETRKIVLKLGREGALLFDPSNKESRLWGLQLKPQSQGDWAGIGAGDNLAAALAAYPLDDSEFRNTLTKAVKFATAYCKNAESIFGHGIGGIRAAVPEAERDEVKVLVRPVTSSPPPSEASSKLRLADARWWIEGFLTVDRELQHEIEGALTAIEGYWNKPGKRPLILAICGGPGSGKSTLARGLAAASKCEYIETNVSQWTSLESLGHMCEQIRDANLRPSRPLIFIDEVDAPLNGDYLYARLLAPLWDGVYLQHGRERPLGSAVFILAGSNDVWKAPDRLRSADDKHTKLKDLVSRITIDPIGIKAFKDRGEDRRYLVANLLRRRFPRLGKIDAGVLESLVNARPLFDIRSMELFIGRSRLSDPQEVRPNDLDVALQRWNTFFEERLVLCTAGRWIEIVD